MNQNELSNKALLARIIELEDKFVKLKRMYEDAINNIDENNFATSLVKKIGDMETKINISAEGITSMVTNELAESMISQKAGEIKLTVESAIDDVKAEFKVEADSIAQNVKEVSVDIGELGKRVEVNEANIVTNAESIKSKVDSSAYGEDMFEIYSTFSTVEQTAEAISTKVGTVFGNIQECDSKPTESLDINKVYYWTNADKKEQYMYYNGTEWKTVEGTSLFSCFTQTADGFKLKGDFTSTTNSDATVNISGTRIDVYRGDEDAPKLSMGYDSDAEFLGETVYPFIKIGQGNGGKTEELTGFRIIPEQGIIYKTQNALAVKYYDKKCGLCGLEIIASTVTDDSGKETDIGYTTINLTADKIKFNDEPIKVTFGG